MPPTDFFDLDAYLERIGQPGRPAPDLAGLRMLHARHPQAIPFENLDPLMRVPVSLDVAALQAKLVRGGRGGWCYEHNLLFMQALQALGFEVRGLAARVVWNRAFDAATPARTHMLLALRLDGADWIADVGFGGLTLAAPLRLQAGLVQQSGGDAMRLANDGAGHRLEVELQGEWKPLYRFDLQPQEPADYELANWYLGHHPSSQFLSNLMVARSAGTVRHTLRNNELSLHRAGMPSERQRLTSVAELRAALTHVFGLRLPAAGAALDDALDHALQAVLA